MSAYDDDFYPFSQKPKNIFADDSFSENGATQNILDGAIRQFLHLFQLESVNWLLIRDDGSTLDTKIILYSFCSILSDLVTACLIHSLQNQFHIRIYELCFKQVPHNSCILIPLHLHHRATMEFFAHFDVYGPLSWIHFWHLYSSGSCRFCWMKFFSDNLNWARPVPVLDSTSAPTQGDE